MRDMKMIIKSESRAQEFSWNVIIINNGKGRKQVWEKLLRKLSSMSESHFWTRILVSQVSTTIPLTSVKLQSCGDDVEEVSALTCKNCLDNIGT